jgi:hypothetical protein
MQPNAAQASLTPSEVVCLNGSRFAPKGGFGDRYKLLGEELEVSKKQLSVQVYAAAFAANMGSGNIRLDVREKKVMFGMRTVHQVFVEAGPEISWPPWTLEAAIGPVALQLQASRASHEVKAVVSAFLREDADDPWNKAIDMIRDGLAHRGLLVRWEEKKLKIFTVAKYSLPPETAALAAAQLDGAQALLAGIQQSQPDLWNLLTADIAAGINSRTTRTDTGADD